MNEMKIPKLGYRQCLVCLMCLSTEDDFRQVHMLTYKYAFFGILVDINDMIP